MRPCWKTYSYRVRGVWISITELPHELGVNYRGVVADYTTSIEDLTNIDINAKTFPHHIEAYNVLASTRIVEAKRLLRLVRTKHSTRSYKDRISNVEVVTYLNLGDFDEYSEEEDWIHTEYSLDDVKQEIDLPPTHLLPKLISCLRLWLGGGEASFISLERKCWNKKKLSMLWNLEKMKMGFNRILLKRWN